ncbi:MAG: 2'-deoxycytidine 5'-triphosphate deaminase [Paracoccaceae bacterium]|nr:2'-deoxycytidine 5'-triphosphate deaminase [Paracoccaceae bacterium]MDE2913181.1 2'-deoxycytidine 5'-triphosphate deaminase [Paracoccaceae bacterium]
MTPEFAGVLPSQDILKLASSGRILSTLPLESRQVQPASLDLRLGRTAWRIRASFLAGQRMTVGERLAEFGMHEIDISAGAVLEKGCVHLVPLMESLALPRGTHAVANAKSSIGRLDVFTRCITDFGTDFDRIEDGYRGPLFAEITPRSFSILVRPRLCLSQIRFRRGQSILDDDELRKLDSEFSLVDGRARIDNGLEFSVDLLPANGEPAGYRARTNAGLLDLGKTDHYEPSEFWEPVYSENGRIILDPGTFYILVSREAVSIPPYCAAEMVPYIAMIGEFRVHYAGFFDPGFGRSAFGGERSRSVLEVRCHEAPFVLEHGQGLGRLVFERMAEIPDVLYGSEIGSSYQGQGLRLSKHFRQIDRQGEPEKSKAMKF